MNRSFEVKTIFILVGICLSLPAGPVYSQEQTRSEFTPVGSELAGNADGSIPIWSGGLLLSAWPQNYNADGPLLDPFPEDKPRFIISACNYRQYAEKLSAGHQALFAKYPDYVLPVYPTRRSVSFPEEIYLATAENLSKAKLSGIDAVTGAKLGLPFPRPKSGVEVLWNHRLRYHADSIEWSYQRAVVQSDGHLELSRALERVLYRYANVKQPADLAQENVHSYLMLALRPAEAYSDYTVLFHDPVNARLRQRLNWGITLGYLRRFPALGFDEVGIFSRRIRYADMMDMFNGSFERYTFKLLGKKELYVPYNSFRLNRAALKAAELLLSGHLNQRAARYELHRVWVVEATLRPGEAHSIGQRRFYVDEDSWSILLADCYDARGQMSRFQEGHLLPLYPIQGVDYAPLITYDLKENRYFADRLLNESPALVFNKGMSSSDFAPSAVKARYAGR